MSMMVPESYLDRYIDRQVGVCDGFVTVRLYPEGYLVRHTFFDGKPITREGLSAEDAAHLIKELMSR